MILLAIISCLLFFATYFTGIFIKNVLDKYFLTAIEANFFEIFLFGLMTSFIYFNLLSFFIPVNYLTVLPLLLLAIFTFLKKDIRRHFFSQARQTAGLFFSADKLFFSIPVLLLFFFYWIIPPLNSDSGQYHYIAIRWYEQFKIIPGLANVHGRLGFNPANFIISAAWSFTDLAGQPIYPLNGVLVLLFFTWLLKKVILGQGSLYSFIILLSAILLFRISLVNISSPSSDLLPGILLFYCGCRIYELIDAGKNDAGDYFSVLVITSFSITAKLSAAPSLLIIPFVYVLILKKDRHFTILLKSMLPVALIIVPWLIRNFVLSGYLLYPVPRSNLFYADWAVPHNVVQLDYIFSKYGPRTITVDFFSMQKMTLKQLTITWFEYMTAHSFFSLLIAVAALLSPVSWLLLVLKKRRLTFRLVALWAIYYIAVWIWLINSPEHRFGLSYMILAMALPAFELIKSTSLKWQIPAPVFSLLMSFFCLYYSVTATKKTGFYYFSVADCWLRPLRDYRYFKNNDIHTFPSVNLGNGVKLYLPDNDHACLNANGPCMNWPYGKIEMRGNKIENGFRNTKDEVKKYFPFVDVNSN